jgi:hypothetical protein
MNVWGLRRQIVNTSNELRPAKKRKKFHSISASPVVYCEPELSKINDLQSTQ